LKEVNGLEWITRDSCCASANFLGQLNGLRIPLLLLTMCIIMVPLSQNYTLQDHLTCVCNKWNVYLCWYGYYFIVCFFCIVLFVGLYVMSVFLTVFDMSLLFPQ